MDTGSRKEQEYRNTDVRRAIMSRQLRKGVQTVVCALLLSLAPTSPSSASKKRRIIMTRRIAPSMFLATCLAFVFSVALAPLQAEASHCSTAAAAGRWAYTYTGTIFTQNGPLPAASVGLDKSEGAVKDKNILGSAVAPLALPERLRTKALEISR